MEELDLKDLLLILWKKKILIIVITLIVTLIGAWYTFIHIVPKYKASTKLLISQNEEDIETTKLITNSKSNFVANCVEIIKSKPVLKQVSINLKIDQLKTSSKEIEVKRIENTDLIVINVTAEDPNKAATIANELASVSIEKIKEINDCDTRILEEADIPDAPYNINHLKDIVMFIFIGIIISFTIVYLIYFLKN